MSTDVQGSTGGGDGSTGGGTSGGGSSAAGDFTWNADWRARIAGADPDELKRLERFQAPDDIYRSYRALERRVSAGELRPVLKKDATPEEQARWRSEIGVPADPKGYKITLPDGRPTPKDDDPFIQTFLKSAHEANYTQGQVDASVRAFYQEVDRQEQMLTDAEKQLETKAEDDLRKEWGNDYRVNKQMAEALLARAPQGFRDRFMQGYLADRTPIRASVDAWKWLVQMEREINPAATVVPGAGGDLGKTVAAELADLKAKMGNQNSEYWKGPKAEAMQERYRQLLGADAKLKAKAA